MLILFLFSLISIIYADEKLLEVDVIHVKAHRGLLKGSELVSDIPFRVSTSTSEDVALTLVPDAPPISISPSISPAGKTFHLIVTDPEKLYSNSSFTYELQVIGLITGYSQTISVTVDVDIKEGEAPLFEKDSYEFKLDKNILKRTEVGLVKLSNTYDLADSFAFSLHGSLANRFDTKSRGTVVTVIAVPCEGNESIEECVFPTTTHLILQVTSIDGQTSQTLITVTQPSSSSPLRFTQSIYNTTLSTGSVSFSPLILLSTTGGDRSSIIYSLIDKSALFTVHPTTGLLSVQHPEFLDVSTLGDSFNMTARVVDGSGDTKETIIEVIVKSGLSIERRIQFEESEYNLRASPGESGLGQLRLQSIASTRSVTFSISEGVCDDVIQIHNRTGEVRYTGEIEKDDQKFDLKVLASSGQSIAVVPVSILIEGIGSYVPKFTKKDNIITIIRNIQVDSLIHQFIATDRDEDSHLHFSILTTTANDMIGTPLQDPDFTRLFRLEDNGTIGKLYLDEDISALEVLSMRVEVEVRDDNHPNEIPDRASLLIIVEALESSKSIVPLLQPNRVPELVSVPQNLPIGGYIYTVSAKPSISNGIRSEFWYELNEGAEWFEIDSMSGVVRTIKSIRGVKEINAVVVASHLNTSTSIQIPLRVVTTIVMDKPPKFTSSSYNTTIEEDTRPGTKILTVLAADEDIGDTIHYELEGIHSDLFEVNDKGHISLRRELDREKDESLHLFVKAIDSTGIFDIAPISLIISDSNDSEPFFPNPNLVSTIMEDAPIGSFVVQAKAEDRDNSILHYEIRVPNDSSMLSKLLSIDGEGIVTTTSPIQGLEGTFIFEVIVSDGVHMATAEVNMEVLHSFDCHPSFDLSTENGGNFVYEIHENTPINFALGQVKANPLNEKCNLEFTLWDTEKNEFSQSTKDLSINKKTGELLTNRVFDSERDQPRITVILGLRSRSLTTKLGAELRVIDHNDNPVRFIQKEIQFKIRENSPFNTTIGSVEAYDKDLIDKIFYRLEDPSDLFSINSESGEIKLIGPLDRELQDIHRFTVLASNSDSSSSQHTDSINVIIHVDDVNDNAPKFLIDTQTIILNDDTVPGSVLIRVRAEDPDIVQDEDTSGVFYRIDTTTFEYRKMVHHVDHIFSVGEHSGDIRLEKNVKDFTGGTFNILLAASDRNDSHGHESFASIKVIVHSQSDLVVAQVNGDPSRMTRKVLDEITTKLSKSTSSDVHLSHIGFSTQHGKLLNDVSDIFLVFTGKDSGEPIAGDKMIAKMDRLRSEGVEGLPIVRPNKRYENNSNEIEEKMMIMSNIAPVFIILLFFFTLLVIVIFIFSLMVCFYKRRLHNLNKKSKDFIAITKTEKKPQLPSIPPMLAIKANGERNHSSSVSTQSYPDSFYKNDSYDIQEAKMNVVNPEDD